jgi:SAM-dependent methyltransferase
MVQAYALPKLRLIESVVPLKGASVLDIGCGPGVFTRPLSRIADHVVGIDRSGFMLDRSGGYGRVQGDALSLPFRDESFDICFEANVLHHVEDAARVVSEMARVARRAVVFVEPNRMNPIMALFSLVTPVERGGLKSSRRRLEGLMPKEGWDRGPFWTVGMVSQNNTPQWMLPILRWFDFSFPLGEYHVTLAQRNREGL